jgi:hypothetical protein
MAHGNSTHGSGVGHSQFATARSSKFNRSNGDCWPYSTDVLTCDILVYTIDPWNQLTVGFQATGIDRQPHVSDDSPKFATWVLHTIVLTGKRQPNPGFILR